MAIRTTLFGSFDRRAVLAAMCLLWPLSVWGGSTGRPRGGDDLSAITRELTITPPDGAVQRLDLAEALRYLHISSVSIALIANGELVAARAYGDGVSVRTLYQAASLSKLVTAVAVLRLVEQQHLDLDRDVNADLVSWQVPATPLTRGHPVTLRGLLSMTGGIGVPGYLGYEPGSPLPNLVQILAGTPPANSPPVRVEYVPGSRFFYSGGGYEIVQAIVEDVTQRSFDTATEELVFRPIGMADSRFIQPLPMGLADRAATGHRADGSELPGGWRVIPELAAGGLWSTASDMAKLLVDIGRAYRGEGGTLLSHEVAATMLTRQNGGSYGLGAAIAGVGDNLALMKRGQNIGYQSYMLIFPHTGQGIVMMTGSDNGTTLSTALIRRAAAVYSWPPLEDLPD
jgi:CubicO group peptidase (beta-lactamase class C family)